MNFLFDGNNKRVTIAYVYTMVSRLLDILVRAKITNVQDKKEVEGIVRQLKGWHFRSW